MQKYGSISKIVLKKAKKVLTSRPLVAIMLKLSKTATKYGGIAQLGERLNGIQEVSGSIPLISTTKSSENSGFQNFFFVFSKKNVLIFRPSVARGETF